ncbi:methionine ABC transporter ATP-binding protein [Clostridium cylindrosporum]|uniref:Methionine import ATP-binding protein MetN n=1 Tax=Clostridium cylindrosporum DSM 605 TaxID=1121307 RepID=A0A0J8DA44_CLOCY|nr:methionine ABC transporter ATP-binding protein [Clostridium cylindrosporum]KMT21173.1 methionine import ATP-binding protein MetN [Clostridium cylindrosporum DSM 605]
MIQIKNLSKIYMSGGQPVEALKNINLTIDKGDIYGIIGLSGAGKSSLVRCINLLEVPSTGEIIIDGLIDPSKSLDITKVSPSNLRRARKKIGMIFQHFNLLMNSTVYENIAFPLKLSKVSKSEIDKRVNELLEVVGLSDKKNMYPSQLSGGQKQRVGIARALANNPEIILCDEATSALDPTTTESILSLIKDINKKLNITVVVITHEMDVIKKLCNKVAVLERGIVVEKGNVVDVFAEPQTKTSREFLKDMVLEAPNDVLDNLKVNEKLLRLFFKGEQTNEPIVSRLSRTFDLDVSIIAGNIETIQGIQLGNLIIKVTGDEGKILNAIDYLNDINLKVEVI